MNVFHRHIRPAGEIFRWLGDEYLGKGAGFVGGGCFVNVMRERLFGNMLPDLPPSQGEISLSFDFVILSTYLLVIHAT